MGKNISKKQQITPTTNSQLLIEIQNIQKKLFVHFSNKFAFVQELGHGGEATQVNLAVQEDFIAQEQKKEQEQTQNQKEVNINKSINININKESNTDKFNKTTVLKSSVPLISNSKGYKQNIVDIWQDIYKIENGYKNYEFFLPSPVAASSLELAATKGKNELIPVKPTEVSVNKTLSIYEKKTGTGEDKKIRRNYTNIAEIQATKNNNQTFFILPIINKYLKDINFNENKNHKYYSYKFISFNFNPETNKLIKKSYSLLASAFRSMFCFISKPTFLIGPDKIIIQFFYYFPFLAMEN